MINLEDHIVEVNGVKMVPYDIAVQAVGSSTVNIAEAMNLIQTSLQQFSDINKEIND